MRLEALYWRCAWIRRIMDQSDLRTQGFTWGDICHVCPHLKNDQWWFWQRRGMN